MLMLSRPLLLLLLDTLHTFFYFASTNAFAAAHLPKNEDLIWFAIFACNASFTSDSEDIRKDELEFQSRSMQWSLRLVRAKPS
ncbi:hypothetical protein TorRG33x02_057540 [Trema orientale]|uniref:Secreted protein n=1 Tax=Trema orientale TaxID=63057 RepID=A0A2P5FL47_TREOI|nr:hypothetical protein TorRG33x02_057540 [Trema orientale]